MKIENKSVEILLDSLKERAKELNCLYGIEEVLNNPDASMDEIFHSLVNVIPQGWQYPDVCQVIIRYGNSVYRSMKFPKTKWVQKASIEVQDRAVGVVEVYYTEERPTADEGPFLKEERRLINTIAERLGHFLLYRNLKTTFREWQTVREDVSENHKGEWRVILDLLQRTDHNLYVRISRKMMNYLSWHGVKSAQELMQYFGGDRRNEELDIFGEANRPLQKTFVDNTLQLGDKIFEIAAEHLSDKEILSMIQKWIQEDKSSFLMRALENQDTSLTEICDAIMRFYHLAPEGLELSESTKKTLNVSLIRRFFTDQLDFINIAKNYVDVSEFYNLLQRMIYPTGSHGKLGGKSAGLFLAYQIIRKSVEECPSVCDVKTPRTWYITSDGLLSFLHYNNLEEVIEQKYKDIGQIRQEYPHIVQVFINSHFPPEIVKGLSVVLDDLGDKPLIVRSSSLLEDRLGSAFSGKYKSLFLANQGTKEERLEALLDAIAEVYSSTFSPDPIEYRAERKLLDFHEEMGILIQEVVGKQVGKYFLPAFAGVAFSNNEFRWSPRIKREDGLLRLVPGLGTRAVDRLSDDYPILIAPGQPGLRVNVTPEEIVRYSPKQIDIINLETNSFETVDVSDLLREYGEEYPKINRIVSIAEDHHLRKPFGMQIDFQKEDLVVTFEGLVSQDAFVKQLKAILDLLQSKLGYPVDIEFAHDGQNFYLLQCRPQSFSKDAVAAPIPRDIPEDRILFTANKYISNGRSPDITHVVYVDPEAYSNITSLEELREIGRTIGKLNKILPKRQFVLMGPGRWGSRGDIKLGVCVTYSDISNTAVLIEIARKKGNYTPDLSFGTHFFQDLVESAIRYLPLYPDEEGIIFNERFLLKSPNILADIAPEFSHLSEYVRVIDVPKSTNGYVLRILMNADLDEALGVLASPSSPVDMYPEESYSMKRKTGEEFWRWRLQMATRIASQIDPERFGVKGFYIFGSTKNATAGPGSDIDILIHFDGSEDQRDDLLLWLDGWSHCLAEMNYQRTGYKSDGLLDVHLVTDEDIRQKQSFALKIGAITDPARPLPLKNEMK